jgi:hypothetical protein
VQWDVNYWFPWSLKFSKMWLSIFTPNSKVFAESAWAYDTSSFFTQGMVLSTCFLTQWLRYLHGWMHRLIIDTWMNNWRMDEQLAIKSDGSITWHVEFSSTLGILNAFHCNWGHQSNSLHFM